MASLPPYTLCYPYFLTLIEGNKESGSEEKLQISEKIQYPLVRSSWRSNSSAWVTIMFCLVRRSATVLQNENVFAREVPLLY